MTSAFKWLAVLFLLAGLATGAWAGSVMGASFGVLVFSTFLVGGIALIFFAAVNSRIDAKIALLQG